MNTTSLKNVYESAGPFATVLLDVSHDHETAADEHRLRVREARERLEHQGADDKLLAVVEERISATPDQPSPVARLVVASGDGVLLDETAQVKIDELVASHGPLPDLAPWAAHLDGVVSFVLAVVDHVGGDVATYRSDVPEPQRESSAGGETTHVHKVPVGGWANLRYQHETENVWKQNADDVAAEIRAHLARGHRLVVLAGDPYSRSAVAKALEDTEGVRVIELESGSRAEDGGDEALQQAVREALMEEPVRRRLDLTHELRDRLGREHAVAAGVRDVAEAFVRGQVQTLLIDPPAAAELTVDPREHPGLQLSAAEERDPLPADQAMLAAAVLTDAQVAVLPAAASGGAPVAALLRWDQND